MSSTPRVLRNKVAASSTSSSNGKITLRKPNFQSKSQDSYLLLFSEIEDMIQVGDFESAEFLLDHAQACVSTLKEDSEHSMEICMNLNFIMKNMDVTEQQFVPSSYKLKCDLLQAKIFFRKKNYPTLFKFLRPVLSAMLLKKKKNEVKSSDPLLLELVYLFGYSW
jgi:hypothetical protein